MFFLFYTLALSLHYVECIVEYSVSEWQLFCLFCSYLILTNQTTFELVRRRRIHYLRLDKLVFWCFCMIPYFYLKSINKTFCKNVILLLGSIYQQHIYVGVKWFLLFWESFFTCQPCFGDIYDKHIQLIVKGIRERVHPFNGGVRRNLYYFCCARNKECLIQIWTIAYPSRDRGKTKVVHMLR